MLDGNNSLTDERQETVEELYGLLVTIQRIGQRLANETHGEPYDLVSELNELLHQSREKAELIRQAALRVE